jgi:porphobilinogen synthase
MGFPAVRLRRLRINPLVRSRLTGTVVAPERLVAPLFVRSGRQIRNPIPSMPGQFQLSIDQLLAEARELYRLGVRSVLLFGIPARKDAHGSEAYAHNGIVQVAVRALKGALPELLVITDLCFCEYTDHGHCGIVKRAAGRKRQAADWQLDNDTTLEIIARTASVQAQAGADIIAPSGMIDGMVKTIRRALDSRRFQNTLIMSYAVKYASAFYGPFRDAAESAPRFGDRKSYQMNPANAQEALREAAIDLDEGADILMVKPALAYLDIVRRIKETVHAPVAAYNVSGEYAMVKAAAQRGWIDERKVIEEILLGMRRAGADLIITYHAKELAASRKPLSADSG